MTEPNVPVAADAELSIDYWSTHEDDECLSATSIADAITLWLDEEGECDPMPETITVYGYRRLAKPNVDRFAESVLERTLESLDQDYYLGDPDDETKPTAAMQAAARTFAEAILKKYRVFRCDQVTSQIVRVADYV